MAKRALRTRGGVRIKRIYDTPSRGKHSTELRALRERAAKQRVTLLYGAKDSEHNQAVVLAEALQET